jgi:hypothetical protein
MPRFIHYSDNAQAVISKISKKNSRYHKTAKQVLKTEANRVRDDILLMISARDHPKSALRILNRRNIGYAPGMKAPHRAPIIHIQSGSLRQSFLKKRPQFVKMGPDQIAYRIGFDEKMRIRGGVPGGGMNTITVRRLLDYLITGTSKMIPRDFIAPVLKRTSKRYWEYMAEAMEAATNARE